MELLKTLLHGVTRSKLVTICGLVAVFVSTLDPALFEGHPRLRLLVTALGAGAAAMGRALLHKNVEEIFEGLSARTLPLVLVCALVVPAALVNVGCAQGRHAPPPPTREKLQELAGYGRKVVAEIDANKTLPDELLAQGLVTQTLRDEIVRHGGNARRFAETFAKRAAEAADDPAPDWGRIAAVVSQLVDEVQAIEGLAPAGAAQRLIGGAQIALRFIANYFALRVSEAHALGYRDAQIAWALGLKRADLERVTAYARAAPAEASDYAASQQRSQ